MAELQASSKELEEEFERDLASTEKREKQLQITLEKTKGELDEWKASYIALAGASHSLFLTSSHLVSPHRQSIRAHCANTPTHFHTCRRNSKQLVLLSSLFERGCGTWSSTTTTSRRANGTVHSLSSRDCLLKIESRAMSSTLQDLENRYGKAIERTALLEEELVSKARLEEENQRLKDELRGTQLIGCTSRLFSRVSLDLSEELSVMREQRASLPPPTSRPITPPGGPQEASETASILAAESRRPSISEDKDRTPRKAADLRLEASRSVSRSASIQDGGAHRGVLSASTSSSRIPSPSYSRFGSPQSASSLSSPHSASNTTTTGLSRSVTMRNVSSHSSHSTPSTSQISRQERGRQTITEMKTMTDRVKSLTARLDSRRTLPMAGSSIPRPRGTAAVTGASSPDPNLSKTIRRRSGVMRHSGSSSLDATGSSWDRAPSPALRASRIGRPPSRISSLSTSSSGIPTPTTSRPNTPVGGRSNDSMPPPPVPPLPARAPTPHSFVSSSVPRRTSVSAKTPGDPSRKGSIRSSWQ
jgi:hypothetical protein